MPRKVCIARKLDVTNGNRESLDEFIRYVTTILVPRRPVVYITSEYGRA